MKNETSPPRRRSTWQAAISQLPGFPAEDKPRMPEPEGLPARQVSPPEEEGDPQ